MAGEFAGRNAVITGASVRLWRVLISSGLFGHGQINLASFPNPQGLLKLGENLYSETTASGAAVQATPGQNGLGNLRQGFLELSNVEPVRELIDLITTQRSFELNSQAINAGDQILQQIANLRRQ